MLKENQHEKYNLETLKKGSHQFNTQYLTLYGRTLTKSDTEAHVDLSEFIDAHEEFYWVVLIMIA